MKTPTETLEDFRKRLNEKALEDEEEKPTAGGDSSEWYLGEQTRNRGSIHSDVWVGTAADLAARGVIGVYPVSGWWKDQPKRDRSAFGARYSLIVSIETDAEGADIWTPVAQQIGTTNCSLQSVAKNVRTTRAILPERPPSATAAKQSARRTSTRRITAHTAAMMTRTPINNVMRDLGIKTEIPRGLRPVGIAAYGKSYVHSFVP